MTDGEALVLYQTEDGRTRIQGRFEDQSLWHVDLHLKAIFEEGELVEGATLKSDLIVRLEAESGELSRSSTVSKMETGRLDGEGTVWLSQRLMAQL